MIVLRFLDWVETAPSNRRAEAVGLLARAWLYSDLCPEEAETAEAALTTMLDDPSIRVRRALAEALSRDPKSPSHIVLSLARDQIDVAEIVLGASPVLCDEDLIDLAATSCGRLQVAIAARPWVSPPLAAAIAEVGDIAACRALCGNDGAELSRTALRRLVERFGGDPVIRRALTDRSDCPIDVRQMLVGKLSEALSGHGLIKATLAEDRLGTILREARDKATLGLCDDLDEQGLATLADHMHQTSQLTPSLLLRALCNGQLALFQAALVTLSGMPAKRVNRVLAEYHSSAFTALLSRAGLPSATFGVFAEGLRILHDLEAEGQDGDLYQFSRRLLQRLALVGSDGSDDEVQRLFALLRRFAAESARDAVRAKHGPLQMAA